MVNFIWCTRILDEDPSSKSFLAILNFWGPSTNQVDYIKCTNIEIRLATSLREEQLGQHVEASKSKNMGSFIRGRQTNLEDFTTLLENLCATCVCLVILQLKSNRNPVIWWFV